MMITRTKAVIKAANRVVLCAFLLSMSLLTGCLASLATPDKSSEQVNTEEEVEVEPEIEKESSVPFALGEVVGGFAEAKYPSYGREEWGFFLPDFAMVQNHHNNPNFYESIDGEILLKEGVQPRMLVLLPPKGIEFSPYYFHFRDLPQSIISLTDFRVNKKINEILVNEVFKYETFFNESIKTKDVKHMGNWRRKQDFSLFFVANDKDERKTYPHRNDSCSSLDHEIEGYDLVVAPALCMLSEEAIRNHDGFVFQQQFRSERWFSREKLYQQAVSELQEESDEYQHVLTNSPERLSLLIMSNFKTSSNHRLEDGSVNEGVFCSVAGNDPIDLDAAVITEFQNHYPTLLFEDLNALFYDVSQELEHSCRYIVLTVQQKEKLKTALNRENVPYAKPLHFYRFSDGFEVVKEHYDELDIESRDEYIFYKELDFDQAVIDTFKTEDITTFAKHTTFKELVEEELPATDLDTIEGLLHAIGVKAKAEANNQTITAYLQAQREERVLVEEQRRAAEAERAKRRRAAEKEKAKEFPYYAQVSCGVAGVTVDVRGCFTDTTLTLAMDGHSREKKSYQLRDLGRMANDMLVIDLTESFYIKAQNASDTLGITIEIKDRLSGRTIASDQANSLYSVASIRR